MIPEKLEKEIREQLEHLALEQQRQVVDFARALATAQPHGTPGQNLLSFAGTINSDDLKVMTQAIEEGCEKVNIDEW